jgi:hypothetical protein
MRFTALVKIEGNADYSSFDGFEVGGREWVVLRWRPTPDGERRKPRVAIPGDRLSLISSPGAPAGSKRVAHNTVPKEIWNDPIPQQAVDQCGLVFELDLPVSDIP